MIITDITKIGDPQIVLYEGKYYCYATGGKELDGKQDGFYVWVSEDLANWSEPVLCFKAIDYWGYTHFWAPEVVYHNGKFVMHYSARWKENDSLRIGVAVSDSPTGPFIDVWGKPMFDLGYATIDGSILVCDEGNFLYYSRDCSENQIGEHRVSQIYVVQLNDDLTKTVGEHKLVTTPTCDFELKSGKTLWNEGPNVIKLGDKYLMNYSANCYASRDYSICLAVSDSPWGEWVKPTTNPVLSCREDMFGAGHNAFFTGKDGELYTAFHIQTNPEKPSGDRRVVIGKVKFDKKGDEIVESIE